MLGMLILESGSYELSEDGVWSGPNVRQVLHLQMLFTLDDYPTSSAVVPQGYDCLSAAAKELNGRVEWPEREPAEEGMIH